MITKDLLNNLLSLSIFLLFCTVILNLIFLFITRSYSSQDFFKSDFILLFFKATANISLLLVCILQFFIFYFFFDFSLRVHNVTLFFDILSYRSQAYFYGKMYDYNFSRGLLNYNYNLDSFGLVIQFVGIVVGYLSYLVLDTRFFYKNIKYLSIFSLFSIVVILFTTTNNMLLFFFYYELLLLPAFLLVYFLSQARRATQASLYFVI